MRLGELLALRWDEVDLLNKTLQVHHTVDYRRSDLKAPVIHPGDETSFLC